MSDALSPTGTPRSTVSNSLFDDDPSEHLTPDGARGEVPTDVLSAIAANTRDALGLAGTHAAAYAAPGTERTWGAADAATGGGAGGGGADGGPYAAYRERYTFRTYNGRAHNRFQQRDDAAATMEASASRRAPRTPLPHARYPPTRLTLPFVRPRRTVG